MQGWDRRGLVPAASRSPHGVAPDWRLMRLEPRAGSLIDGPVGSHETTLAILAQHRTLRDVLHLSGAFTMFFALDLAQASAGLLVGLAFALLAFPLRAR